MDRWAQLKPLVVIVLLFGLFMLVGIGLIDLWCHRRPPKPEEPEP